MFGCEKGAVRGFPVLRLVLTNPDDLGRRPLLRLHRLGALLLGLLLLLLGLAGVGLGREDRGRLPLLLRELREGANVRPGEGRRLGRRRRRVDELAGARLGSRLRLLGLLASARDVGESDLAKQASRRVDVEDHALPVLLIAEVLIPPLEQNLGTLEVHPHLVELLGGEHLQEVLHLGALLVERALEPPLERDDHGFALSCDLEGRGCWLVLFCFVLLQDFTHTE